MTLAGRFASTVGAVLFASMVEAAACEIGKLTIEDVDPSAAPGIGIVLKHSLEPAKEFLRTATPADAAGALYLAAQVGDREVVRFLVIEGVSVNSTNELGETPLMAATSNECTETVRLLLGLGADPRMASLAGLDALTLAIARKNRDLIRVLLEGGAVFRNEAAKEKLIAYMRQHGEEEMVGIIERAQDLRETSTPGPR